MVKRKSQANASPPAHASAVPPPLPPSVEEAYRRKCLELKQRSKEVDDVNDATRLRIARLKRQVDKLRVERAFLLEQLSKRTSTNVEDSDGSPSPPPTPEDKPLRIKRGSTFIHQHLATALSPSSDAFPRNADSKDGHPKDAALRSGQPTTNGISSPLKVPKKPLTAFEMYADELRAKQATQVDDAGTKDMEGEIAAAWKDLTEEDKEPYLEREQVEFENYSKEMEEFEAQTRKKERATKNGSSSGGDKAKDHDADVESEANSAKSVRVEADAIADSAAVKDEDGDGAKAASNRSPPDEDVEMGNDDTEAET